MNGLTTRTPERCVDAHQHFWKYDAEEYPWIQRDWPIRKSFLPEDLKPLLTAQGFDACVAVQARQTFEETIWLLELAQKNPFIAGVVGWVNLLAENGKAVAAQLERLDERHRSKLVGVRHVVQDEPDDAFMLRADFLRGIQSLKEFGLTYDILIFPKQLPAAIQLVRRFPEQSFVLDHIAKPVIREGRLDDWQEQIRELAKAPNVMCKLSGMVTEAPWKNWHPDNFKPYLDVVWEAFGEDRLMVGSDWPVCLLSAEYAQAIWLVKDYVKQFGLDAFAKVMGGNATRFYKLRFD